MVKNAKSGLILIAVILILVVIMLTQTFNVHKGITMLRMAVFNRTEQQNETCHTLEKQGDGYLVPNNVHYVWYSDKQKEFRFLQYLSVLSVHKFQKPDNIYFHTNNPPFGKYWEELIKLEEFVVVKRERPRKIFGEEIRKAVYETSDSDVSRVKILLESGGIYLDTDVWLIRSLDPLRTHPCVLGAERTNPLTLCGGVILAIKSSTFLKLWMEHFLVDYRVSQWTYNSGIVPTILSQRYPDSIYVEMTKLHRPAWNQLQYLYGNKKYPWQDNYSIHLWHRMETLGKQNYSITPESIQSMKSTYGQVARHIYNS